MFDLQAKLVTGTASEATCLYNALAVEQPLLVRNSPAALNAALDCHSKCSDGRVDVCEALVSRALAAQHATDTITFNTLINVHAKRPNGSAAAATAVLQRMEAAGFPPSRATINSLIDVHRWDPPPPHTHTHTTRNAFSE
jgi:protein-disulfide isomerase-like protein with CxxC motif